MDDISLWDKGLWWSSLCSQTQSRSFLPYSMAMAMATSVPSLSFRNSQFCASSSSLRINPLQTSRVAVSVRPLVVVQPLASKVFFFFVCSISLFFIEKLDVRYGMWCGKTDSKRVMCACFSQTSVTTFPQNALERMVLCWFILFFLNICSIWAVIPPKFLSFRRYFYIEEYKGKYRKTKDISEFPPKIWEQEREMCY